MTTSTASTIPARTVREIRAAIALNGRMLDSVEGIIRSLRDDFDAGSVDVAMTQALDLSTHLCGIHADLYDELVEAQRYEEHLDYVAETERVLAEYRLDQRL
jgi:hypothetical protein